MRRADVDKVLGQGVPHVSTAPRPRRPRGAADLLPARCVAYELVTDQVDAPLFAEEEHIIVGAPPARRAEFTSVRLCARRALEEWGVPSGPLLPDVRGAPRWPAGFVGSMTHCAGYAAAVVASSRDVLGIGLDAEPHLPLPPEVLDKVAGASEQGHLADMTDLDPSTRWDRLLFCAKEAVYKLWSPLTGAWLGFHDAEVHLETDPSGRAAGGGFTVRLLVPGPVLEDRALTGLDGRWSVTDGRLLVAVWVWSGACGRRA
jgi:enterobactin synthetase component D / holo-[acyl-carrier protein] synthase